MTATGPARRSLRPAGAMLLATGLLAAPPAAAASPVPGFVVVRVLSRFHPAALTLRDAEAPRPLRVAAGSGVVLVDGRPAPRAAFGGTAGWVRLDGPGFDRRYPGSVHVRARGGELEVFARVPLEDYVAGVVSAELPAGWPPASLQAQAIVARTVAARGGAHPGGNLCDLTHCQAYAGEARREALEAAEATRGQVLTWHDRPIQALYASTCGGVRAPNQAVFGGEAEPYLQGGPDPFCQASPFARPWTVHLGRGEVARVFGRAAAPRLAVLDRAPGGWVARVAVDGEPEPGYRLWQRLGAALGWGVVPSLNFALSADPGGWTVRGVGLGHGVGLCQWGARGRAIAGWDARRILAAYYPGTRLVRATPVGGGEP